MQETRGERSVLIIDDDEFVLRTTGFQVQRLGYPHVLTAKSAERALALMAEASPPVGVVVTDLNMPGFDGIALLRHFNEQGFDGDVVLISGEDSETLNMAESLARARNLRVLGAVAKPIDPLQLARVLSTAIAPAAAPPPGGQRVSVEQVAAAIEADAFEPWFQPKIDVASREPVGVEALARWPGAPSGPVYPDAFIPVAEAGGLIDALTDRLVDKAVAAGAAWRASGLALKIALNVSMDSLHDPTFPTRFCARIEARGTSAGQFLLEVTESRLMEELAMPLEVLLRLRMKRVRLSIDDFGTGHSNLAQLRDLPFDELKLDRSYVQGVADGGRTRAILESSVEMAKKLKMSIVAEGVETLEDWRRVEQLGCDQVQGYLTARPMPGDAIPGWVAAWPEARRRIFGAE
ncbi:EAL domain-containing response regulator [Endothiovibrio diazotrophicus]